MCHNLYMSMFLADTCRLIIIYIGVTDLLHTDRLYVGVGDG